MSKEKSNPIKILLGWAGPNRKFLILSVLCAFICGLCAIIPYLGVYRLINAILEQTADKSFILQNVLLITGFTVLRFLFFALSGAFSHKGAYGVLFQVRCKIIEHMAKVPLGVLNERRTGDIKAVLNEDIEKLEQFLAHNIPDLVHYLVGPVVGDPHWQLSVFEPFYYGGSISVVYIYRFYLSYRTSPIAAVRK